MPSSKTASSPPLGIVFWNKLPQVVVDQTSLYAFKTASSPPLGIEFWNKLPQVVVGQTSLYAFKTALVSQHTAYKNRMFFYPFILF